MSPSKTRGGDAAEADFQQLADITPVMMWRADPLGRGVWFNRPWLEFAGRTMAEELGEKWLARVHPADRSSLNNAYGRAIARREEFSATYRLLRHDGVYRSVLDKGRPMLSDEGELKGFVGSCIDLTEQKESEEKLLDALSQQALLLQEVRHRVRNNMQTVVGFATLLSRQIGANAAAEIDQMLLRIRALAHMQQHFYGEMARSQKIELCEFLRSFANEVARDSAAPVHVEVVGCDMMVDVGQATSIGLAVVEAILGCTTSDQPRRDIRIGLQETSEPEARRQLLVSIENHWQRLAQNDAREESVNERLLKLYARLIAGALEITKSNEKTRIVMRIAA